jgi:hypothetical protein|tara:strand:+ start:4616 stop:4861 length:246 start_codon:yes stop_codon:yes gene_type:complete
MASTGASDLPDSNKPALTRTGRTRRNVARLNDRPEVLDEPRLAAPKGVPEAAVEKAHANVEAIGGFLIQAMLFHVRSSKRG